MKSDPIERQRAIKEIERFDGYLDEDMIHRLKIAIGRLPSAEIIRCKGCRWWSRKGDSSFGYCYAIRHSYYSRRWEVNIYRTYEEDFYCADAELRTEEEKEKNHEK